jgi:hypothetical protein
MNKKGHRMMEKKKLKLEKYLCFTISKHGNHCNFLFFHSYECQIIQTINPFDNILNVNLSLKL